MQKITTFLWFDNQAEEATKFYTSIFKDSKIGKIMRYNEAGPGVPGTVMTINFWLDGQEFIALNGGPDYHFTEAVSLFVNCKDQAEVDYFWEKLSEGGEKGPCGWLKDKYGLSWQVVPAILMEMLGDKDAVRAENVNRAMLKMNKLDIQGLKKAYEGV